MKRTIIACSLLLPAIAAAEHKLVGVIPIINNCSEERQDIELAVKGEVELASGTTGLPTKTPIKSGQPFVLSVPDTGSPKRWKITSVTRKDGTPVCSCISCQQLPNAKQNKSVKKCIQSTGQVSDESVDNDKKPLQYTITCSCQPYVPD